MSNVWTEFLPVYGPLSYVHTEPDNFGAARKPEVMVTGLSGVQFGL